MLYLFNFFVWLLCLAHIAVANDADIRVSYSYQNQLYQFTASKDKGGYLFNPQGKTTLDLVTLEWPPYIGTKACNHGWAFQLAVAAITSQDYALRIRFLPWSRAVYETETGQSDILFPEYQISPESASDFVPGATRHQLLALSKPIPGGNVSLIKRKHFTDRFDGDLDQLKGKKIGVVRGYENTPEFDKLMDQGAFKLFQVHDDLQLMRILLAKRVDYIVGDPLVLRYRVNSSNLPDSMKAQLLEETTEVTPYLGYNPLFFAVSTKHQHWQTVVEDINRAIESLKDSGELSRLIQSSKSCMENK